MANPELFRHAGRAFVIAKEDDLCMGMQESPALQGISLNDTAMSDKWFSSRKKCEHLRLV
jgi:hypothetical protein